MSVFKGAVVALGLLPCGVQASTFSALPTVSDFSGNSVSLWFDNLLATGQNSDFVIVEPGTMTFNDDGTSELTARTFVSPGSADGFDIEMSFADIDSAPAGLVPANASYKNVFNRIPGVPDNIELSVITGGQLTGFGGWESLVMNVIQFPDPGGAVTQVGGGTPGEGTANQHNENFGMSTWFAISSVDFDARTCTLCDSLAPTDVLIGSQGDVVLDLAPVPIPASVALLLTGIAGMAGMARRKR